MGYVAASHLDSVLAKLDAVSRNESAKRSSGLFGFIKVRIIINKDAIKEL